jgi:hypothetical protein
VVAARPHGAEVVLAVGLVAVPLPFLLLPDGAAAVWPTVDPVTYPAGLDRVAAILEDGPDDATVAALPWRSYRGFGWGNGLISSDPAPRWFNRDVLVSDDLPVGRTTIHGESVRGSALGADLAHAPVAEALRDHDVAWALVYLDDPGTDELDLTGLTRVHADHDVALYRVPGAVSPEPAVGVGARTVVALADLLALGCVLGGGVLVARRRRSYARPRGG